MLPIRIKACSESDLRMLGDLARNIQRVLPVTQADIDAAAALGQGWVVWKVIEVTDPIDNLRGGTQLVIKENSITPGKNIRRVLIVSGPGGETVVVGPDQSPLLLPDAIADSLTYVKAYGGTEQRNIPAEYVENQFIYMLDGSYLAVRDQSITSGYKIEFDFATTNLSTSLANYFGARASGVAAGGGFRLTKLSNLGVAMYGFDTTDAYESGSNIMTANTRYKYVYENGTCTLSSGGTDILTHTYTVNDTSTITAFGINAYTSNGTTYSASNLGIYFYGLKIWNTQGELVADYVPATLLNPLTVGIYDRVSKTHLLPTSGTWSAGPAVQGPTPDHPIDIVCNNGVLKARHQSGLPLGYTLLDSVVFDSTQVIDTGFTPGNETRIESKCYRTGAECWFYGASPSNPRITLYLSNTGTSRWGNQSRSSFGFAADTDYVLIEDKNGLSINGTLYPWTSGTAGDFTCDRSLTIGNNNGSTGTRYFAGNFYYMKIYNNGVLVRDFVPCQNASNVVGLYDMVNGVFYTDTGLVAGNTVSDPVEIYTDGTVETIEDTIGNTATAEMLLKVGDYQDVQEILAGDVTRKVGVLVLDGTEDWSIQTGTYPYFKVDFDTDFALSTNNYGGFCSHFSLVNTGASQNNQGLSLYKSGGVSRVGLRYDALLTSTSANITSLKQWLSDQYAAGTPVMIVYVLATETTESVTGQTLQVQDGDNTLEITQASIDDLELEAEYEKVA